MSLKGYNEYNSININIICGNRSYRWDIPVFPFIFRKEEQ
jgi:hypothetical protein